MQRKSRLRWSLHRIVICLIGSTQLFLGCARDHYHQAADHDTYHVLDEKVVQRPWQLPFGYSVNPSPESRLFDPTDPNDPALPPPGPNLYAYQIPHLTEDPQFVPTPPATPTPMEASSRRRLVAADRPQGPVQLTSHSYESAARLALADNDELAVLLNQPAADSMNPYADGDEGLTIQPIPAEYWKSLPPSCLSRMLEFESIREEYRRTFKEDPPEALRDQSRRLTFGNIVELAHMNSREYQAQKEVLYSSALALTLQRYDYMVKFSTFGNGADVNYDHLRSGGTTVNGLSVPSSARMEKMMAFGGTLVAQFANNILLTFNGPTGFAEDISSSLLFDFTQSVYQRDVLLEPLVQSERNVVYAARNFARFRKQFFFDLARAYYLDLLATYRGIEIDTQNYFAFVRALDQAEAEVRSGVTTAPPRFQIDQIEQNMLAGRSRLISTCNNLETSLDRLKLQLGLPTETPINIDLSELVNLTLRDEIEVAGELVRRAREQVTAELSSTIMDREETLSAAVNLLDRILARLDLQRRVGDDAASERDLVLLRAQLRVDEAYEAVGRADQLLVISKRPPVVRLSVFRGTMTSVQARLELVARQLQLSDLLPQQAGERNTVLRKYVEMKSASETVVGRVVAVLQGTANEDLQALQTEANAILQQLIALDAPARRMVQLPPMRANPQIELQQTLAQTRALLQITDKLATELSGLTPVNLAVDDAMVTAIVQRFELMNEREFLADDWRGIKLAADDLKSVLNLNVRQSFQTPTNQPFNFSFENSRTELRTSIDLPLNRRQQRNGFRQSLINYQAGRRSLMALEDNIKFSTRQDLRQLDLNRIQYEISVVSAALASERVYSTQLELSLGLAAVAARDFLEAQRAYRESVSAVATGRLGYIVNRAQLALDLELMLLDDDGVWPELTNEDYQPTSDPIYPFEALPTYGALPYGIHPTKKIQRMLHVPNPGYQVIGIGSPLGAEQPEELPTP